MKKAFGLLLLLLVISVRFEATAQQFRISVPPCDSTVLEDSEGHRSVSITPRRVMPSVKTSKDDIAIRKKQFSSLEEVIKEQSSRISSAGVQVRSLPSRDLASYAPGFIPVEESVSHAGARLYSVPIAIASGWALTPSISLAYNSQSGNNTAGFGWGISGISSISVRNTNLYYDGQAKAGVYDSFSADYALDGVPIVISEMGVSGYPLSTARGNVLIQKHVNATGRVLYFSALFPDGSSATYGSSANTQPRVTYPITELTDINGNTISFDYELYDNYYYITSITYGQNASILFSYSTRSDASPYEFAIAGCYVGYPRRLLKTITSKDGSNTICQYSLTHELQDGVSLLKELHCTSGGSEVPPLLFEYGIDQEGGNSSASFSLEDSNIFLTYYTKSDDLELQYHRGRFIPGNPNDGLAILPSFKTYTQIGRKWSWQTLGYCYQYGSMYNPEQSILCNFTGYYSSFQKDIPVGAGFQLVEAVDVDGDGIDELVKINNGSNTPDVTFYTITIYSFDAFGDYTSTSFTVNVNAGTHNAEFNNPANSYYRFGNFRGDGNAMLLIMTGHGSKFALVDLNSQEKLSETSLFTIDAEENNLVLVADFENDGKADLCHITTSGMTVYSLLSDSSTSFSVRTTYGGVSKSQLYSEPFHLVNGAPLEIMSKLFVLDLNGDGYLDIASAPALNVDTGSSVINTDIWNIARFNGKQFSTETYSVYMRDQDDKVVFLDVDNDGLPDILQQHGLELLYSPNINGVFSTSFTYTHLPLDSSSDIVPGDCSLFSSAGVILVSSGPQLRLYDFSIDHSARRSIERLSDSHGIIHTNAYVRTGGYNGVYLIDNNRAFSSVSGFMRCRFPMHVLYSGQNTLNSQTLRSECYTYWDAIYHNRGLGFCGFGKILTIDYTNGVYTYTTLNPEKFGVAEQITMAKSYNGTPFSTVVNTYDNNSTTYGKLNPRLTNSIATDALTGIETTTTYTYGSYDLPTSILTSRRIGSGTAQTEQVKRTYENSVNSSKYVIGVITEESVIKEGDGSSTLKWKEKSVNTYDSYYRPLTNKKYVGKFGIIRPHLLLNTVDPQVINDSLVIIDPIPDIISYDATNLVSETRWQYDTYGNVISETSAPYGVSEFTGNTYTYDSNGRYLTSKTDALGHTTLYSGYNKFGAPTIITDYRNWSTIYTYDDWGNTVSVNRPGGIVEQTSIAWGGAGLYTISNTVTGRPENVTHYDALGREIRIGEKRFDGHWQWVDKEYNDKGLLYRTSLPYRGTSAAYWNTYTYDQYNRPITLTEASGKVSSWSYNGTSVTTIKDGITSTSTTDANGNAVSVTDAGGTITYTLRDDGQPSKVTAPGNVSTTFTYDEYGRRTKIVDPSAGTQSDSYLWNSDGSSRITHTGPNGTVKTYRDKFGRTTLIERPGEYNTTYTYDLDGRLSTELSTNGTGMEYTYDSYDRIVTTKETVPDGKWLRKVYGRSAGSIITSVQYINQSGPITTETYIYANGHNTGITLSDGTVVWSLTSENDFGMPTAMTTGTISREYGYTAFGLPTYRRMDNGDLQDFTYQFDVSTGNLLSRSDLVNGQTETFGYDNLNRLVAIGSRQISYAANGNILSMDGVGDMYYGTSSRPYQITMLEPEEDGLVPNRMQNVSYTCYNRPSILTEGGRSAAFTYNGDGDRVKMYMADSTSNVLTRYYIGGRYEYDQTPNGTKERLYLGGDAYSAPMVYQKVDNGSWTAYNIGRDYLGNITHIATTSGTLVAEYSYDPWGRLRNPETLDIYPAGYEPELFLGRGYTGHEHMTWFGLVNMNARLYDPLLGRFLSPDPYVQAPDFTQNYNRYSYAFNNPLRYADISGEVFISATIWAAIGLSAVIGGISGWAIGTAKGAEGKDMFAYVGIGAAIGGVSALASIGISALGGAAYLAGAAGGAIGGAGFRGLSSDWDKAAMLDGLWKGALSGAAGGLVGSAIGGGLGAFCGGSVSSCINSVLNQSSFEEVLKSAIIGGLLSYGCYELLSYIGWTSSGKRMGTVDISFRQYKAMQSDFQRSRFWHKEYGGYLMKDGSINRFPAEWRHEYGIGPIDGPESNIPMIEDAMAIYHTHWDTPNKTIMVDYYGRDVSKLSIEEIHSAIEIHQNYTARGHGAYDYLSIDSFVINRYETSFSIGGSGSAYRIYDSFLRYFPWYYLFF